MTSFSCGTTKDDGLYIACLVSVTCPLLFVMYYGIECTISGIGVVWDTVCVCVCVHLNRKCEHLTDCLVLTCVCILRSWSWFLAHQRHGMTAVDLRWRRPDWRLRPTQPCRPRSPQRPSVYDRTKFSQNVWSETSELSCTYLSQAQRPQHFPRSVRFFSASFMSELISSKPSSIRSSCSEKSRRTKDILFLYWWISTDGFVNSVWVHKQKTITIAWQHSRRKRDNISLHRLTQPA